MMHVRADQLNALAHAIALQLYHQLVAELQREHPERDDLETFVEEVIIYASRAELSGFEEVSRLARLMMIDPDRLAGHPLSTCILQVLEDTNRTGTERLNFIDKHLLPRVLDHDLAKAAIPGPREDET